MKINRRGIFSFVLVGTVAFLLGSCFQFKASADKTPYRELEKYAKILQYIESNFVDMVVPSDLVEGSIKGMLQTLDPHSAYLTPELYRQLKSETSGKFGGLGIEVSVKGGVITVVAPIEDTPAFRAGIKTGDRIIKIAGKDTKTLSLTEAVSLMRGKPGSKIAVTVYRKGVIRPIEYELIRESIKVSSVKSQMLPGGLAYLRLSSFIERSTEDMKKSFEQMNTKSAVKGVILDLRGNPGGLLDQAVKVSNLFVEEGPIVYTIGRDKEKKEVEYARKGNKMTDVPMVVLVDSSSASASEIVAGALQDHGRAVIAGQTTFGKGSVQTIIPVGDESGLKLTIARYYTPSGRSIQARGISPDFEIDPIDPKALEDARKQVSEGFREVDLDRHFDNEEDKLVPIKVDQGKKEEEEPVLKLEEKLKKDYMVIQAEGILKTMTVVKGGIQKPVFKLEEEKKKEKGKEKEQ